MPETTAPSSPLARFTVLDLSRVRAGPTCARQFADWGANVIKIEAPEGLAGTVQIGGPRHGPDFQNLHRNKRSLTLNLRAPEGLEIFNRLVAQADVVIENFRPDVKTRLGIDYESLKQINAGIVYGSISGFGQDGPYAKRPGFDQIAQGMGGLMSITGMPGQGPVRAGIAVADLAAGIFCALGILIALLEREVSGEGQWVQSSLLTAQISLLDFQAARWLMKKDLPGQAGNDHPTGAPTGTFETADGHINIAAGTDIQYRALCAAIGAPELADDPEFTEPQSRARHRPRLNAAITAQTRAKTSAEWIEILNQASVPCGPIYDIKEVFEDPQVRHMGMTQSVHHALLGDLDLVGQPIKLSRGDSTPRTASPEAGEHNAEILESLGYGAEDIARLHDTGVI